MNRLIVHRKNKYDIAISVAEEDVAVARQIADAFKKKEIDYFFYEEHSLNIWGEDLLEQTLRIYGKDSSYVLMIIGGSFKNKYWQKVESQVIVLPGRKRNCIFQLYVADDVQLWDSNIYMKWENNPDKITELIAKRLEEDKYSHIVKKWLKRKYVIFVILPALLAMLVMMFYMKFKPDSPSWIVVPGAPGVNFFLISRTEITVGEFRQYCLAMKQPFPPGSFGTNNYPIANLTYDEAEAYCHWVGGRLPTSAEWEYAATKDGNPSDRYSGSNRASSVAQYSTDKPSPVAQKAHNALGVYDMTGNVAEWCSTDTNVQGKLFKIVKGGSYLSKVKPDPDSNHLRITHNDAVDPGTRKPYIGFRVVWDK